VVVTRTSYLRCLFLRASHFIIAFLYRVPWAVRDPAPLVNRELLSRPIPRYRRHFRPIVRGADP